MAFSVPPVRVTRRSSRSVLAAAALIVLIVAAGVASKTVLTGAATKAATSVDGRGAGRPPASAAAAGPGTAGSPAPAAARAPRLPPISSCQSADPAWCAGLLRAAMVAFDDAGSSLADEATILSATVWHSLVCDSPLDCPRSRLDGFEPAGSVVLEFSGGGPRAWINVVSREASPGGPRARVLDAWIARWG